LIALIPAVMAKIRFGVRFIIDTGDIAELLARKVVKGFIARWKIIITERFSLRWADSIVVRGTYHRRYLVERGFNNIWVIQDGVNMKEEIICRDIVLQNKLGLSNCFVIGLMGNSIWNDSLGMCYGWDLVEAVALLKEQKIKGLVIGGGDGIEHLRHRAEELGISQRIVFIGRLPYDDIGRHLRLMDVALSTQTNDPVGWARTTGKLPEYLKAGCYVLASAVGEASLVLPTEMLIEYEGGGRDDRYPQRLAEKITHLINKRTLMKTQKDKMLRLAFRYFDYRSLAANLADCLTVTAARSDEMLDQKG
jgi:glycosyltransferase involved in cell wall biosynthesis